MVYCTLDDKVAFPSSSDKIKVTYENPFIKDSGSYTYDITFPMSIAKNREIFANAQRLDVKKSIAPFEECRIYVDNRLIMSGKGTVTNITNDKVKVQIVGGISRIKYNSKFESHYIDEINYPNVVLDSGIDTAAMKAFGYTSNEAFEFLTRKNSIFIDLTKSNIVGQKGVAVCSPINDETNDCMANRVSVMKNVELKMNGHKNKGNYRIMSNLSVSPYLLYVLKKVVENEGYSLIQNDFDKYPWNKLVIVNACKSGKIKDALPHWTVYKFFDELRKFFNASFVFDEISKTLRIKATNELLSAYTVAYDCEDEFSSEYDEDGLDNLSTSNIEYNFDDSANRDWRDYISQSVFKDYAVKTYSSVDELVSAAEKMTDKERRTTIFKVGYDYYIWAELPEDGNPENENLTWQRTQCGFFNPIIRDIDSDDSQKLNICPAAVFQRKNYDDSQMSKGKKFAIYVLDAMGIDRYIVLPSVTNQKESSIENMEEDDDGDYYYTVQDAMQDSSSDNKSDETEEESKMPVAFQADCVVNMAKKKAVEASSKLTDEDTDFRVPVLYTDYRMYPTFRTSKDIGSLSLDNTPVYKGRVFGNLNGAASNVGTSRFETAAIDKNNLITIKFITDDIPDPSKIYIFRNKRYICSKVEMNVTNDGIDREKTGYFYELL